ncbi:MAG TPA: hypothetical protein VGG34_00800 [Opitutaceae bacterium]|jgi:hypothetical protein
MNPAVRTLAGPLLASALAVTLALPGLLAQGAAGAFDPVADAALAAMKAKAEAQGIKGTAMVAFAPGDTFTGWTSKALVIGQLVKDSTDPVVKGSNFLGNAYSKASEMAATGKDSGGRGKDSPAYWGEVGWKGGATAAGKTGRLFAAFSGGTGDQDYATSQAGLAVLKASL